MSRSASYTAGSRYSETWRARCLRVGFRACGEVPSPRPSPRLRGGEAGDLSDGGARLGKLLLSEASRIASRAARDGLRAGVRVKLDRSGSLSTANGSARGAVVSGRLAIMPPPQLRRSAWLSATRRLQP